MLNLQMGKLLKVLRWTLVGLLLVVLALGLINGKLVGYGLAQARGQLNIIWNARPVLVYLNDPNFADSLKAKLRLIEEIRQFATDSLALKDTENYTTLYDQRGEEVMWVVTASERYQLRPKEWEFPVIGAVPYKGFFEKEKAIDLARQLQNENWDVNVRNPSGWSTLGWFTDPILSKMLARSDGDLASLIIHEMVHATIFVKDSVNFNENVASFVGDRGAEEFLIWKYGKQSTEYITYIQEDHDYIKYVNHMLHGTQVLDSVYKAIANKPADAKEVYKQETIQSIVNALDTLTRSSKTKLSDRFKEQLPNNAYFMAFIHYQSGQDELWAEWKQSFDSDLKSYIQALTSKYPFL